MTQLRTRLLVLALIAGLMVPVTAFARVLSICNMRGRTARVCCCHRGQQKAQHCKTPAAEQAPCCTQLISHADKGAMGQAGASLDVPPAALVGHAPALAYFEREIAENSRLAARARAPPQGGPPLFLRDCRILS